MERRLAAILSADIVDYSRMMQRDEVGTLAAIKRIRQELIIPKTRDYRGRSIKLLGDGELMEFVSIVDAVTFAVEIQLEMAKRNRAGKSDEEIWFRIGINIGDIIVDEDDIYGDGVNLAARVENIAEPGGICLTNTARSQIIDQLGLEFRDLGLADIKGFERPVQLFSVVLNDKAETAITSVRSIRQQKAIPSSFMATKGVRSTRGRTVGLIALAAAGIYGITGIIQTLGSEGRIKKNNVFCPLLSLTSPQNPPLQLGAVFPREDSHGIRAEWGINEALMKEIARYPFQVDLHVLDSSNGVKATKQGLDNFSSLGVQAVIGPMNSENAFHAKIWGNATNTPVVSPLATASYLTNEGEFDYFFRTTMSDGARARNLVQWMREKGLHNNPYLIHEWAPPVVEGPAPEIYGASQATAAKRHLGHVETIRFTRGGEQSMLDAASRVKNDGRAVIIFGYTSNVKIIIQALQERGIENDIFLMGVVTKTLEEAGFPFPEKIHVVTPDVSEARSLTDSARLQREFEDDNPDLEYDISTYYAYDTVTMILDAANAARKESCAGRIDGLMISQKLRQSPNKRRKMINGGFMSDVQEVFFRYDGLKIVDGRFRHVGISK